MKKGIYLILYITVAVLWGCAADGSNKGEAEKQHVAQPSDTLYTEQKAMAVYDYQPERALQIIDSAEAVGNLSAFMADLMRMKIFGQTYKGDLADSLVAVRADVPQKRGMRYESVIYIGERLLENDTAKASLALQEDVLEMMLNAARQLGQADQAISLARQLVDVCHQQGAETEALRNEAEIGALLCAQGLKKQGFAKLDSVLVLLDGQRRFNELDALIIASKRKMDVLAGEGRYLETLPLAKRIIDRLDDYELHPKAYHDGTYREPQDAADRTDYIQFYRSQAQGRMTAAYALLGQQQSMEEVYQQIERTVREAVGREHIARYQVLEQQSELERKRAELKQQQTYTLFGGIIAVLAVAFAVYFWRQKRIVAEKNRVLVRQIDETMKYKRLYEKASPSPSKGGNVYIAERRENERTSSNQTSPPLEGLDEAFRGEAEELFLQISSMIEREQLFLNPNCDRQMLVDRLQISKERIGAAFSRGSSHPSLSAYINNLRLDHAYNLLISLPSLDFEQVALRSGFSSRKYFGDRFKLRYGMTLTEFAASRASLGADQSG